jgi:type I restriction enzyme S subunit
VSDKQTIFLGDVCSFQKGASVPRDKTGVGLDIPYLHYGDIYKHYSISVDVDEVFESIIKISANEKVKDEQQLNDQDIVYNLTSETIDDLGKSVIIRNKDNRPFVAGMETTIMRVDRTDLVYPPYLNYVLQTKQFYRLLQQYVTGMKVFRVHPRDISRISWDFPSLQVQKWIANLADSITERISKNTKINHHLEQMAQAVWAERFGEREPNGVLGDIIELFDSKRVPLSGNQRAKMEKIYPYYGAATLMDYVDNYLFDGVYLLLGEDGTVVDNSGFPILQYVWGKFWVNNHAHVLQGRNGFTVESLYTLLKRTSVTSIVTGAVQLKINQANLKSLDVVIPSEEEMQEFNALIEPLFSQIRNNNDENLRLAETRDTLLPRLMSGELSVADIVAAK